MVGPGTPRCWVSSRSIPAAFERAGDELLERVGKAVTLGLARELVLDFVVLARGQQAPDKTGRGRDHFFRHGKKAVAKRTESLRFDRTRLRAGPRIAPPRAG